MRMISILFFGSLFFLTTSSLYVSPAAEPHSFKVGRAKVWTLRDVKGEMDVFTIFPGNRDVAEKLIPGGRVESNILAFLIQVDGENVLADTGLGSTGGPRVSRLLEHLAEAGVSAEDIGIVVLTHMHGDHIGGLLRDGERAFPNAVVKLSRLEYEYWMDEKNLEEAPGRRGNFELAWMVAEAYGDDLVPVEFGQSLAKGLMAREAIGHTPGHMALYLESGGKNLMCVGDLIHAAALQFPRPDMSPRYDMDPETARVTRERYLRFVAEEGIPIAGMHLPMPGVGMVRDNGDGSFVFMPLDEEVEEDL